MLVPFADFLGPQRTSADLLSRQLIDDSMTVVQMDIDEFCGVALLLAVKLFGLSAGIVGEGMVGGIFCSIF